MATPVSENEMQSIRVSEEKKRTLFPTTSTKIKMPHLTDDFLGVELEGERTQQQEITRNGLIGCWIGNFDDNVKEAVWNFILQHKIDVFNLAPDGQGLPGDGMNTKFDAPVAVLALPPSLSKNTHQSHLLYSLAKCFQLMVDTLVPLIGHVEAFRVETYSYDARAARDAFLMHETYFREAMQYRPKTTFTTFVVGIEKGKDLAKSLKNPTFYSGPIGFTRFEAAGAKSPQKVYGHMFVGNTANISEADPKQLMKEGNLTWIDQALFSFLFEDSYYKDVISQAEAGMALQNPSMAYLVPSVLFRAQTNSLAMLPYKLSTYIDWNIADNGKAQSRDAKVQMYCRALAFAELYRQIHEIGYYSDVHDPVKPVTVSFTYPFKEKSLLANPTIMNRYAQGQYMSREVHDQSGRALTWLNMSPEATASSGSQFRFCLISPLAKSSWPDEHKELFSNVTPKSILLDYPASMPGILRVDTTKPIIVGTELTLITRDPNQVVDAYFVEGETVAGEYVFRPPTFLSPFVETVTLLVPKEVFIPRMPSTPMNCALAMLLGNRSQTAGDNAVILARSRYLRPDQRKSSAKWEWE